MDDDLGEEFECEEYVMKRIKEMDEAFYETIVDIETSIYAVMNKDMESIKRAKDLMLNSKPKDAKRVLAKIIKNRSRRKSTRSGQH